jgi:hypothetical protein
MAFGIAAATGKAGYVNKRRKVVSVTKILRLTFTR